VRRALQVRATGMNACPCAQGLVRGAARERLLAAGFSAEQADTALDLVPTATHNQRATGSLTLGTAAALDVPRLAALVRDAMSAPVHELLKRADELAVVERAHAHPRFVEDSVRHLLASVLASGDDLGLAAGDFVAAEQVNHESIHAHDVRAARSATLATLRRELAGESAAAAAPAPGDAGLDAWLDAPSAG
jgi:GTP cyclohydrolase I/GTP cyclohydrolase-4